MAAASTLAIETIEFVKELYPRLREDDEAIERYRAALDQLPPIVVARGRVIVDGFHRWQAHRREGRTEIAAVDLGNLTDIEIRRESITRNATHGHQLSMRDKQRLAAILWRDLAESDNGTRTRTIMDWLSVSEESVARWTRDAKASEKTDLQARAWDRWLDCLSDRQIASELGIPDRTISEWLREKRQLTEFAQPPDSRQHFDVWTFPISNGTTKFFGAMPPQVVENILWFYTDPGAIVVDPFAGSGTTIDVAKRMGRRVWASDRKPSTPTLPIHAHNIVTGWPDGAPAKADLILLDPPYWNQAAGRYSNDADDLGNMSERDFAAAWRTVVRHCVQHCSARGRIAFIVSPAEDSETKAFIDLAALMVEPFKALRLRVERRIIVPYQTQQVTGQQVTWAREHRRLLKLYRDLVVLTR